MKRLVALAAMLTFAAAPSAVRAEERTESQTYVRTVTGISFYDYELYGGLLLCDRLGTEVHFGGACFDVRPGDRHVDIEARDLSMLGPTMEVWFVDAADDVIDSFGYLVCGRGTLAIPPRSVAIIVHLHDMIPECQLSPPPTAGWIVVGFRG